jgi:hypothetical protein
MPSSQVNRFGDAVRAARDTLLAPPRLWRELLLIGLVFGVYRWVQTIVKVDPGPAYARGRALLHAQQAMGVDVEHPLNAYLAAHPVLAFTANYYYVICHGAVTCAVLVWLFLWHPRVYPAARLALATATIAAFVVFATAPTAPPRLLRGAGFVDTLSQWHTIGGYGSGMMASTADQFAAMPSLHIGWAVWASIWFARVVRRTWARVAAVAYPLVTSLVILATANHYVLDIVGGAAIAGLGELVSAGIVRLPGRRRDPGARPVAERDDLAALRSGRVALVVGGGGARTAEQAVRPDVGLQGVAELAPAAVQPRHHGADGRAHDRRDLGVRQALDVGEVDGAAAVLRQPGQRVDDHRVADAVERLVLRRAPAVGGVPLRARDLPVFDLVAVAVRLVVRLALLLAVRRDVGVREDPVQPGTHVRARFVLVEGREGLRVRLLHEIPCVVGVARHPQRGQVHLVAARQRLPLEALGPVVDPLDNSSHPRHVSRV